jgi:ribosomal protein S18 acetylase RimI-like enzyme
MSVVILRQATVVDLPTLLPRMRAFNASEGISIDEVALQGALAYLLQHAELGAVWMIETADTIGYTVVTYGYDLEFAGRDAYLTELWIDPAARSQGAATAALQQLAVDLRARGLRALHLMVRPDNPAALRLYQRVGFEPVPRLVMTRRL